MNSPPAVEQSGASPAPIALNQAPRGKRTALAGCVSNLSAGSLSALVTLSYAASYAALIFSAAGLQPHLATGLNAALMAAWIVALTVALGSTFHFSIAGPDSNATAILAVMASAIAAALLKQQATPEQLVASVAAMLALSAIAVGLFVFGLGALKRGRLIRFLPYPVVGGFLAGTGFLVLAGGYKVLTRQPLTAWTLGALGQVPPLGLSVALLVALALLFLPRLKKHFLILPGVIVAGVAGFYLGSGVFGLEGGAPLLEPGAAGQAAGLPWLATEHVRWDVLLQQWPDLLAMTVVVVVTILLNATGLDLATQHDADFDRELRVNGLANLASGLGGGMIGYVSISRSLLNFKAGADSRLAGIWTAVLCAGAAFLFAPALAFFPRPVLAGLLLYLGISMLREWCWQTWSRLPLCEYLLIVTILVLIAAQGLITGVAFGILVASIFFVYSYSQTDCIKHNFAGHTHFSNKERSLEQIEELKVKGQSARALCLQGYLFFGTSSGVVDRARELIERQGVRFLLLDFRMVQGLDASAVLSFTKLEQLCGKHGVRLLLSALSPGVQAVLQQTEFLPKNSIPVLPDLDRGLEWIEDTLLGVSSGVIFDQPLGGGGITAAAEMDLRRILSQHFSAPELDLLISHCQTLKLKQGEYLFRKGDPGDALYFVERGELSVLLPLSGDQSKRLRTFGPGTIVGEMALYAHKPRSADVITDMPCRVRKLLAQDLNHLQQDHPEVAIQFHSFVVKLLAARLAAANEQLRASV